MDIIVSGKNPPKKNFLKTLVWVLAVLLAVGTVAVVAARRKHTVKDALSARAAEYQTKLDAISADMGRLTMVLDMAEDMHDRAKYMEVVGELAQKQVAADEIWEAWQHEEGGAESRKGLALGMQHGMADMWQKPFTREDKLEMLASKYLLKTETVKQLKAEIEMMFADELAEKSAAEHDPVEGEPAA